MITDRTLSHPELCQKFCRNCRAATLTAGHFSTAGVVRLVNLLEPDYPVPHFYHECGQAYPWTAAGLKGVQDLADEVEAFSQQDRDGSQGESERHRAGHSAASLASKRLRWLLDKVGPTATTTFKDILVNLVAETAKRQI